MPDKKSLKEERLILAPGPGNTVCQGRHGAGLWHEGYTVQLPCISVGWEAERKSRQAITQTAPIQWPLHPDKSTASLNLVNS